MDSEEPHYASSEEIECALPPRPLIKSVTVPETVKRRLPSKHYVYKVVVDWTDGKHIVIYRKYSFFFDFVVKLNELVGSLSPTEFKKNMLLPELPGRVLFGRSEVHQVAEKRRKKIEEFCQKLIDLPAEVSQSPLVLGFFNTWPDDTMLRKPSIANRHVITSPIITSPSRSKSPSPSASSVTPTPSAATPTAPSASSASNSTHGLSNIKTRLNSATSRSPSPPPIMSPMSDSALEAIISHPDEMESLEQYRVLESYERKDAHQVNLVANQLVHVIEKHDTGWWMVMSEDEQGYAPASYLEPVGETASDRDVHPEDQTNQVYEAMETYFAENDDEITMKAGERIEVISKSMDGWWKIQCNGQVGYSPAALIRRRTSIKPSDVEVIYESEKSIYEGLNIHRPPPRRNTADRTVINKVPVQYDTPRKKPHNIYMESSEGDSDEDTPKCYQVSNNKTTPSAPTSTKSNLKNQASLKDTKTAGSVEFSEDEHIYEMEPTPLYEESESVENLTNGDDGSIYENADFSSLDQGSPSLLRKRSSPAVLQDIGGQKSSGKVSQIKQAASGRAQSVSSTSNRKGRRHTPDDYEDPDAVLDDMENDDYMDMQVGEGHNMYIDPEDLRRGSPCSVATASSMGSITSSKRMDSTSSVPAPSNFSSPKPTTAAAGQGVAEPVFDDDYITMDPLYVEPPAEDEEDKAENTPPKGSPVSTRPLPPPPYAGSPSSEKKSLTRAKSMEDLIAAFSKSQEAIQKKSPDPKRRSPNAPRAPSPLGKALSSSQGADSLKTRPKPPARPRNAPQSHSVSASELGLALKNRGAAANSSSPHHQQHHHPLERSTSPTSTNSPSRSGVKPSPLNGGQHHHHPLLHTVSTPNLEPVLPKTYVSLADFSSDTEGCLSFNAGDKCVLIQQNKEGWWLVNIGGHEGWTPGEYWREDTKRESQLPKAPKFAPPQKVHERKPRSHTVATVESQFTSSVEPLSTTYETNKEDDQLSFLTRSERFSSKDASSASSAASKTKPGSKGPLPKVPILPGQKVKPTKPPKPSPPSKPEKMKTSRDSHSPSSPPTQRKIPSQSPSPPPPLPPANPSKKMSGELKTSPAAVNGHADDELGDYKRLDDISTIESAAWFVGKMERAQAEQFLMDHGRQREFLIRERTRKDGYYALSVRYHYSCKHFNIDPSSNGQYVMGTLSFPTIDHIIQHYQQNSLFIHDSQHVTLSQPVKKRTRPSESHRHNSTSGH